MKKEHANQTKQSLHEVTFGAEHAIWLKKTGGYLALYGVIVGIFTLVLYLHGALEEAVLYAAFLAVVLLFLVFAVGFARHVGRCQKARQALAALPGEVREFPSAVTEMEWMYQEKLRQLSELIGQLESEARINRQEMMDYYGLWAHQIKTPIAAMHILVQSLEEMAESSVFEEDVKVVENGVVEGDAKEEERNCQMEEAGSLLCEMKAELFKTEQYVGMVLSYLRAESMGGDLLLQEYPLDLMIKQAVKKYSTLFISKKIHLDYRECKSTAVTDEKWLLFVLEQLLSNALKYTPREGTIAIYQEDKGKRRLVIEDNGIGISAEDLPRIFEKGFTGFHGRQDKKSTGIGLYLCQMVCGKLGHDLAVESDEEAGTRVYIQFCS